MVYNIIIESFGENKDLCLVMILQSFSLLKLTFLIFEFSAYISKCNQQSKTKFLL